jgi:hypothetical protein
MRLVRQFRPRAHAADNSKKGLVRSASALSADHRAGFAPDSGALSRTIIAR